MPDCAANNRLNTLANWLSRYELTGKPPEKTKLPDFEISATQATDTWSGSPVCIAGITAEQGCFADSFAQGAISRARFLQSIDHAHLQPLLDFHPTDGNETASCSDTVQFFFVTDAQANTAFVEYLAQHLITGSQALALTSRLLSALYFLAGAPPHLVPAIESRNFTVDSRGSLRLGAFQGAYILDIVCPDVFRLLNDFIGMVCRAATGDALIDKLLAISSKLDGTADSERFDSLHQVRTAVKQLEDSTFAETEISAQEAGNA